MHLNCIGQLDVFYGLFFVHDLTHNRIGYNLQQCAQEHHKKRFNDMHKKLESWNALLSKTYLCDSKVVTEYRIFVPTHRKFNSIIVYLCIINKKCIFLYNGYRSSFQCYWLAER